MADSISPEARSTLMARVRNRNTSPELYVRSRLFRSGFRFRLHRRDLPGSPDIVLPKYRTVIFVHGCFWHGHDCRRGKRPSSNVKKWNDKIDRNMERDRTATTALVGLGWRVAVIWSCAIERDTTALIETLKH